MGRRSQTGRLLTLVLDHTGKAQANEQRYSKLKEKYSELVQNHADLLRKVGPLTSLLPCSGPTAHGESSSGLVASPGPLPPPVSSGLAPFLGNLSFSVSLASYTLSSTFNASSTCTISHLYYFCKYLRLTCLQMTTFWFPSG